MEVDASKEAAKYLPNSRTPSNTSSINVEKVKYNFTIMQLLVIGSFLGSTAITIGYAAYSYYKTVDTVSEIKKVM